MDIERGPGVEPEELTKEIIAITGMLNTITGKLNYRQMQVCWCLFSICITNLEAIGKKINWSASIIDQEVRNIKNAFCCEHLDIIKPLFFERYPDYIFSIEREVKVKKKRVRDRRKKKE